MRNSLPRSTRRVARRTLLTLLAVLLVVAGIGAAAIAGGADSSSVTKARLERSLPMVFANVYAEQATLLGHDGVTPDSLHATAMCDKHGPDVADVGPGADWVCLMGWTDPNVSMPPEGYGKFELSVHSNDCWTAAGPSKLTGFLTLTDTTGAEVTNPAFEFDGCFDPAGDDTPTGTRYPSVLQVTSTTLSVDLKGHVGVQVTCGTGSDGCSGTVAVSSGSTELRPLTIALEEESASILVVDHVPPGAKELSLTFTTTDAVGPSSTVTLPIAG